MFLDLYQAGRKTPSINHKNIESRRLYKNQYIIRVQPSIIEEFTMGSGLQDLRRN